MALIEAVSGSVGSRSGAEVASSRQTEEDRR